MTRKTMWHYSLIDFGSPLADLENTIQQVRLLSTVSGSRLQLYLDNSINEGEMRIRGISAVNERLALSVPVTVNGSSRVLLASGECCITDEAEFQVCAGDTVLIRIEFESLKGLRSMCQTWAAGIWQSEFFSFSEPDKSLSSTDVIEYLQSDIHRPTACLGLVQADVFTDDDMKTIVMFGDSITHMSYYTDALVNRVLREFPGQATVLNEGVGGNRLCYDAIRIPDMKERAAIFGDAAFRRFKKDVFGSMQPDAVLVMEGVNDLSHGFCFGYPEEVPTAGLIIEKFTELIRQAHEAGTKIWLCTILPEDIFLKEPWYEQCEALRLEVNDWIRSQTLADGSIDFEAVFSDPTLPTRPKAGFTMDGVHPTEEGGKILAESLPLEEILF